MNNTLFNLEPFLTSDFNVLSDLTPDRADERAAMARRIVADLRQNQCLIITLTEQEKALFKEGYERAREFFKNKNNKLIYGPCLHVLNVFTRKEYGYTASESFSQVNGQRECMTYTPAGNKKNPEKLLPHVKTDPDFDAVMNTIYRFNFSLLKSLMRGVAAGFGDNGPEYFTKYLDEYPRHRLRTLKYAGDDFIEPHVDGSFLTFLHTQSDGLSLKPYGDANYTPVQGDMERLLVLAGSGIKEVAQHFIFPMTHKVQMEKGGEKQSFAFLGGPRGKDVDERIANGFNINYDAL
ncbi:MAG: hypothetical protein R3E13_00305 [Alphaproteobacteria bacterium]